MLSDYYHLVYDTHCRIKVLSSIGKPLLQPFEMTISIFKRLPAILVLVLVISMPPALAADLVAGLIIKSDANPFFLAIERTALDKSRDLNLELKTFSGSFDGDTDAQVEAIEMLLEAGVKGILITPSDPALLAESIIKAREAGAMIVALDTPFDPPELVDATFATDNFKAGELIGQWARARMGDSANHARIAMLDGYENQITVDVLRNQGFLSGFGIDIRNPDIKYDEDDSRIIGSGITNGTEEGGRTALMTLMQKYPDIDLVYTINEPAAFGAYSALEALGKEKEVIIVTIDGGCSGVKKIARGAIDATAMQYPARMALLGIKTVFEYMRTGKKSGTFNTPGLDFHDTGVALVTDKPVANIPSISSKQAQKQCWGS